MIHISLYSHRHRRFTNAMLGSCTRILRAVGAWSTNQTILPSSPYPSRGNIKVGECFKAKYANLLLLTVSMSRFIHYTNDIQSYTLDWSGYTLFLYAMLLYDKWHIARELHVPRVLLLLRRPGGGHPHQHLRRLQQDSLRRLSQAELKSKYVNQFAEYQFLYVFLFPTWDSPLWLHQIYFYLRYSFFFASCSRS